MKKSESKQRKKGFSSFGFLKCNFLFLCLSLLTPLPLSFLLMYCSARLLFSWMNFAAVHPNLWISNLWISNPNRAFELTLLSGLVTLFVGTFFYIKGKGTKVLAYLAIMTLVLVIAFFIFYFQFFFNFGGGGVNLGNISLTELWTIGMCSIIIGFFGISIFK